MKNRANDLMDLIWFQVRQSQKSIFDSFGFVAMPGVLAELELTIESISVEVWNGSLFTECGRPRDPIKIDNLV